MSQPKLLDIRIFNRQKETLSSNGSNVKAMHIFNSLINVKLIQKNSRKELKNWLIGNIIIAKNII